MAKASKPFEGLRCPACGEVDSLSVKVDTLGLACDECQEEVTRAEVEAMVDRWARLLAWIDSAASFAAPK